MAKHQKKQENKAPNQNPEVKTEEKISPERMAARDSEGIDDLRARLYERGRASESRERHGLAPAETKADVDSSFGATVSKKSQNETSDDKAVASSFDEEEKETPTTFMEKKKRGYRLKILLAGVLFFVVALGLSSSFLFFGNNTISGENITVEVTGPFAIGGGEEVPLQITIANQNTIPIESATLIIDYPPGTQSASEPGRELFSERQQLNNIDSGEVINVPTRAVIFGEENEEKTINVSMEYRVRGTNSTLFKEAEPLRFKISSSPVLLSIESVKSISSGQETDIVLKIASNSPTPLSDILVKAVYPFGFDYTKSIPDTVSGQDTWLIASLEPEEEEIITIKGVVIGKQDEDRVFDFSVGVPNERDRYNLASIFTNAVTEMSIEQPFLGIDVEVNDDDSDTVAVRPGDKADVVIAIKNTLDDTIYDNVVEVVLSGNALNEISVNPENGFYDSASNIAIWQPSTDSELENIAPGEEKIVEFQLTPHEDISRTPEIQLTVTVKSQRIFEDRVPQELEGTASRLVRISSLTDLTSAAFYSDGPFTNTGPIPPVAEEVTQYALRFTLQNGSNDVTDGEMTAVLPPYMTWLDLVSAGDDITFNTASRVITWDIGNIAANSRVEAWAQVSFLPSLTQVGTTPTLVQGQRFKATDRFTGEVLRSTAPALNTELVFDPDSRAQDGEVQPR